MAWRVGAVTLCVGLLASLSRGPWLGAVAALAVFALTGPDRLTRTAKIAAGAVAAIAVMLATGVGRQFIDLLPFIGTVDSFNVTYRQRLLDVSMQVFWQHPVLGSFHAKLNPTLESLRQGEGIIDIVNTYLSVALRSGAVGLALFVGVFVLAIAGVLRSMRQLRDPEGDVHVLGRSLLAAMVGMMVIIVTVSSILVIPLYYWSLAGLAVGYAQMVQRDAAGAAAPVPAARGRR
jgi:O-antigen ligase